MGLQMPQFTITITIIKKKKNNEYRYSEVF
jgi:hypothetical protein